MFEKVADQNLIVIGSSSGGPRVLKDMFMKLPVLNASIVIVQHILPNFDLALVNKIASFSAMKIKLVEDEDTIEKSCIHFAKADKHLSLVHNYRFSLSDGECVNGSIPSIDTAMKSVKRKKGGKIVGVVLTGMGCDGAEGLSHIKQLGGITIAQDKESSSIYSMPRAAANTGDVDYVLNSGKIGNMLALLVGVVQY